MTVSLNGILYVQTLSIARNKDVNSEKFWVEQNKESHRPTGVNQTKAKARFPKQFTSQSKMKSKDNLFFMFGWLVLAF